MTSRLKLVQNVFVRSLSAHTKGQLLGRPAMRAAYHRKRGASICKNALRIDQDVLDTVLLQAMSEALDERLTEVAI